MNIPIKYDSCSEAVRSKCSGLTATEIKYLTIKNKSLKYFCSACEQGIKESSDLK